MTQPSPLEICRAPDTTHVVGIAADHSGYELKEHLIKMLRGAGAVVVDFGDGQLEPDDDYPDFVVPLARAVVSGQVKSHGESEWSLTSQHTGQTDLPLTARGEDEARELGQTLKGISFSHVLASPLQRARKTCELADLEPAAEIDADPAEWDDGDYEGQRSVGIRLHRPDWNLYRDGSPHGESPEQVAERVDRFIARLRMLNGDVALFSHGPLGGVLPARWIGLPLAAAEHFPLGSASHSILSTDPHHPEVPVIGQWNR